MEKYKNEIHGIVSSYNSAHEELNEIEMNLAKFTKQYEIVFNKLKELRDREKEIINNIEKETGQVLTSEDLAKLMS